LEEAQEFGLVDHFEAPGLRALLVNLEHRFRDDVHVRLRIHAAQGGEPDQLKLRGAVEAGLGIVPGGDNPAFHGAHPGVHVEVGRERLRGILLLRDVRVESFGIEADFGDRAEAVKGASAALAISRGPNVVYSAARALALAGEVSEAEALIAELAKRRLQDVIAQSLETPEVKAINEINRANPGRAIELLQAAPYDGGPYSPVQCTRGNAYLRVGNGAKAAEEFQKVLALRNWLWASHERMSLAELGLARAYALQAGIPVAAVYDRRGAGVHDRGEQGGAHRAPLKPDALAKARVACQDFLALWKDADPDIPILQQAKAEYAKLK
jgi:tetratricopeptide (TPR) repeat protein